MSEHKYFPEMSKYGGAKPTVVIGLRGGMVERILTATSVALVAGEPDGEDSAGRQRIKRMDPADVVAYAFALADAFVSECEKRGELKDVKPEQE